MESDQKQRPIFVNGKSFHIHSSLDAALRQLRQHDQERRLWIDAICINQEDNEEKSAPVALMRKVYSNAQRVVVWLGKSSFDSDAAINFIQLLTQVAGRDDEDEWRKLFSKDEF